MLVIVIRESDSILYVEMTEELMVNQFMNNILDSDKLYCLLVIIIRECSST